MRVHIGPYKSFMGPYQIADKIPFIGDENRERFGEWLADTWVGDFCQWIHSKQKRKIKVHIDKWDTWSMDHTLAHIILPMLKQLRDTKHGSHYVDEEDLPPEMRHGGEDWVHYKWDWTINEMIWAFEQILDDDGDAKFHHGEPTFVWEETEIFEGDQYYKMDQTNPDYWVDKDGLKRYHERIQNGTRLFGKYFQGLWD